MVDRYSGMGHAFFAMGQQEDMNVLDQKYNHMISQFLPRHLPRSKSLSPVKLPRMRRSPSRVAQHTSPDKQIMARNNVSPTKKRVRKNRNRKRAQRRQIRGNPTDDSSIHSEKDRKRKRVRHDNRKRKLKTSPQPTHSSHLPVASYSNDAPRQVGKLSWKARQEQALQRLLKRHEAHQDKLPIWPLIDPSIIKKAWTKRRENVMLESLMVNDLQLEQQRIKENEIESVRAGKIPMKSRTTLAPISLKENESWKYDYHTHEGHLAAKCIQKFVRQKQSIVRKIKSYNITKVQRFCKRRMAYKKFRRSSLFKTLVLSMTKRIIKEFTGSQILPPVFHIGIGRATKTILLQNASQRQIRRWWRSRIPLRFLTLLQLRVTSTRIIENAYHSVITRRAWYKLVEELVVKSKAAITIQSIYRKRYVRLRFLSILRKKARIAAATKIQRCVHRYFAYNAARAQRKVDAECEKVWIESIRNNEKYEDDNWDAHRAILNTIMHGSLCTSSRKSKIARRLEVEELKKLASKCNTILHKRRLENDPHTPKAIAVEVHGTNRKYKTPKSPPMFKPYKKKSRTKERNSSPCRLVSKSTLINSLEQCLEEENSGSYIDPSIRYLLAFTLLLMHEDYSQAQKLLQAARENDTNLSKIDYIWHNWVKYALRCKQFSTNRVHVLHLAGIINWHCYKRFDLAERFFRMAILRSDKNLNQDIFLYNCGHHGDDENEDRVQTSLKYLIGDFTRDLIVDKGLSSCRLIYTVNRRRVSGKDLAIRVFCEGDNYLIDGVEKVKKRKKKKKAEEKKKKVLSSGKSTSKILPDVKKAKRYISILTGRELRNILDQLSRRDLLRQAADEEELAQLLVSLLVLVNRKKKVKRASDKADLILGFRLQQGLVDKYRNMVHETSLGIGLEVNITLCANRNFWLQAIVSYMPSDVLSYYGADSKAKTYGIYIKEELFRKLFKDRIVELKWFASNQWAGKCKALIKELVTMLELTERRDNVGQPVSTYAIQVASNTMVEGDVYERMHDIPNIYQSKEEESKSRLTLSIDNLAEHIDEANTVYIALSLQRLYRGKKGRELVTRMRLSEYAYKIQRPYRKHYRRRQESAIFLQKHVRIMRAKIFVQRKYLHPLALHNLSSDNNLEAEEFNRLSMALVMESFEVSWSKFLRAKRRLKSEPLLRRKKLLGKKYR